MISGHCIDERFASCWLVIGQHFTDALFMQHFILFCSLIYFFNFILSILNFILIPQVEDEVDKVTKSEFEKFEKKLEDLKDK